MTSISTTLTPLRIRTILIDAAAIAFIYFMPALSHLLALPVYLIEPMRMMLILALVHTTKRNAYILAFTLPLFSYAISAHPVFLKSLLISLELLVNVWLFYALTNLIRNRFGAISLAIIGSKIFYYTMKFLLLQFAFLQGNLFSTPIWMQIATTFAFSLYIYLWRRQSE